MSDLKPCPFCGGEASIGWGKDGSFVNCIDCLASTNTLTPIGMDEAEAIAAWNRRVDTELDALKGRLAGLPRFTVCGSKVLLAGSEPIHGFWSGGTEYIRAADLERVIGDE